MRWFLAGGLDPAGQPLQFFEGDEGELHLGPAVFAQGLPAMAPGGFPEKAGFDPWFKQVGDLVVEHEKFVERHAAAIAAVAALHTSLADPGARVGEGDVQRLGQFVQQFFVRRRIGGQAMAADALRQPLRDAGHEG